MYNLIYYVFKDYCFNEYKNDIYWVDKGFKEVQELKKLNSKVI